MESNWRLNIVRLGFNYWGINLAEHNEAMTLVKELNIPVFADGHFRHYVARITYSGSQYYYLTPGCVPGSDQLLIYDGSGSTWPSHPGGYKPD